MLSFIVGSGEWIFLAFESPFFSPLHLYFPGYLLVCVFIGGICLLIYLDVVLPLGWTIGVQEKSEFQLNVANGRKVNKPMVF